MNLEIVVTAVQSYYEASPISVLAVAFCLLVLSYVKPKFMFKTFMGTGCALLCVMALTSLSGTLDSGVNDRGAMLETARK